MDAFLSRFPVSIMRNIVPQYRPFFDLEESDAFMPDRMRHPASRERVRRVITITRMVRIRIVEMLSDDDGEQESMPARGNPAAQRSGSHRIAA